MKRSPLFWFKAKSANFRVADGEPPLEEVSVVGKGRFMGKKLTVLYTVKITPTGEEKDKEEGTGILYLHGEGRATYKIAGRLSTTARWREHATGTLSFSDACDGGLAELRQARLRYQTLVNSKGESRTNVWRDSVP